MVIPKNEILYKKTIGRAGRRLLLGIGTIGGLHLVVAATPRGDIETLGTGSHPDVARYIASKNHNVEFDDLSKSGSLEPDAFADVLPEYEAMTETIRSEGLKLG
jgi:hypothetical protein